MAAAIQGFLLGLSLIVVIGSQNAFVLRLGIRGVHVLPVVLTCALSDTILIGAGVAGFGQIVQTHPMIVTTLRYFGAAFLILYGSMRFYAAWSGGHHLDPDSSSNGSLRKAILTVLALTWLNPHVYLDTVVLLGSISTQWGDQATFFGIGAAAASFVFFFSLGYGARLLRPLFANDRSWRILDVAVGLLMFAIAAKLLME